MEVRRLLRYYIINSVRHIAGAGARRCDADMKYMVQSMYCGGKDVYCT